MVPNFSYFFNLKNEFDLKDIFCIRIDLIMKILMVWLIWDKFCVEALSDTETASQVQATDHEIDDEETQCDPSAPTNDEVGGDYDYCTDIANVSNESHYWY